MEAFLASRMSLALAGLAVIAVLKSLHSALRWHSGIKGLPLPPGPRPLPLLGNLFDIPETGSMRCERYAEMCKKYGNLLYLHTMGQGLLVVGSAEVAFDLLDKRSANCSSRPKSIVLDCLEGSALFGLMQYGSRWKVERREFWQQFHPGVLGKYDDIQTHQARKFLNRVLDDPADFKSSLGEMVAAILLRVVYNIDTRGSNDPIVTAVEEAIAGLSARLVPTPWIAMVEFLPVLRFWPSFQRRLSDCQKAMQSMKDLPYVEAKARPADIGYVSVLEAMKERLSRSEGHEYTDDEDFIKNVVGGAYAAGGETTFSSLQSFFLAMSLYPEVQKKAQAEIDTVIGRGRLPEMRDVDDLPYVGAIVKELHRWQTVAPFAIPHASVEDDVYNGYFIPAGTIILPNACQWSSVPERFLKNGRFDPQGPDPSEAFGFGRRVCPGRHFAERTLFIVVVSVLCAFDITPLLDDKGEPFYIEPKQTDSQVSFPVDCRCTITPRSEAAASLVRHVRHYVATGA